MGRRSFCRGGDGVPSSIWSLCSRQSSSTQQLGHALRTTVHPPKIFFLRRRTCGWRTQRPLASHSFGLIWSQRWFCKSCSRLTSSLRSSWQRHGMDVEVCCGCSTSIGVSKEAEEAAWEQRCPAAGSFEAGDLAVRRRDRSSLVSNELLTVGDVLGSFTRDGATDPPSRWCRPSLPPLLPLPTLWPLRPSPWPRLRLRFILRLWLRRSSSRSCFGASGGWAGDSSPGLRLVSPCRRPLPAAGLSFFLELRPVLLPRRELSRPRRFLSLSFDVCKSPALSPISDAVRAALDSSSSARSLK